MATLLTYIFNTEVTVLLPKNQVLHKLNYCKQLLLLRIHNEVT